MMRGAGAAWPDAASSPRVELAGDLLRALPPWDPVSPLERFLYGPDAAPPPRLRNPQGLAWLDADTLLVCDQGFPTVVAVEIPSGRIHAWAEHGRAPRCPVAIACDEAGRVYVADTTRGAVLVYKADGQWEGMLAPEDGERFRPAGLAVREGVLYVSDPATRSVRRYSLVEDEWKAPLRPPAYAPAMVAPVGLCFDTQGRLLVADAVVGVVHRVDAGGRWEEPIGSPGRGPGQLVRPRDVACDGQGRIWVADVGRQSVLLYDAEGRWWVETEPAGRWGGFVFPAGVVVADGEAAKALARRMPERLADAAGVVIVSDAMGPVSLTVLAVKGAGDGEDAAAGAGTEGGE